MKLLIVEDEHLLARELSRLITSIEPSATILGQCNSIESTVKWLKEHEAPELIFMDIELADGQCFEIFDEVEIKTPVIFTTAYDEFAIRAFKVNSIDYLLKPIQKHELESAINKWKDYHGKSRSANLESLLRQLAKTVEYKERFLVKQGQKLVSIHLNEVAFFNARNTLNYIITRNKQKFIVDHTLDELEKMVDPKYFFRANRQYIIAHDIITAVHPWFNGKLKIDNAVLPEEEILVSRERAAVFKEWLGA
jgi:two-component system, LytTR family, response regulator LytT